MSDPDSTEISRPLGDLGARLRQVPDELKARTRTAIRTAANPIAAQAKRNTSWSSRIPRAIRVGVRFTGRNAGATIRVSLRTAPHARAFEDMAGRSRNGRFRHPVFGRDRWTTQATRPFIAPAVDAHRKSTVGEIDAAVTTVLARAGFATN